MASAMEMPRSGPSNAVAPAAQRGMSEDWLAVCIGLLVFTLSLGLLFGADLLGWAVKTSVWMVPAKALAPVSKNFSTWPGITSLLATFGFLLVILVLGARAMRTNGQLCLLVPWQLGLHRSHA